VSSFIVDDGTINDILAAAQLYTQCNLAEMPPPPRDIMSAWPQGCDWALLGQALREMNVAAVIARYGPSDDLPGPFPLLPYEYRGVMPPSPIQAIKTLACYLYQCSEGDIPEQPLYRQLRKWEATLYQHYVTQSDEWQQASWA